jgi:hypothetical protein
MCAIFSYYYIVEDHGCIGVWVNDHICLTLLMTISLCHLARLALEGPFLILTGNLLA